MKTNVAASIRAQLRNLGRTESRPFQEVLQFYGLERFLVRLARSRFRDRFVLKGALLLGVWDAPVSRPTRDIDFLGRTENSVENLEEIAREIYVEAIDDDGIEFDPGSIVGERIKEDADRGLVSSGLNTRVDNVADHTELEERVALSLPVSGESGRLPEILAQLEE